MTDNVKDAIAVDMQKFNHDLEAASLMQEQRQVEGVEACVSNQQGWERDDLIKMMGQVEAAQMVASFVNVVSLSKLAEIKKNKSYQKLNGFRAFDREGKLIANVNTWAGFCRTLGVSHQKVDMDILNLNTFGEEALERLNQLGVGYRALRKLRQLPDAERTAIIEGEIVQLGDREEVVALIEDLVAKHVREKEDLTTKLQRAESALEATDRLLVDKDKKSMSWIGSCGAI